MLANADQNRLDDVNRCIKQLQDDIKNLERTLYARELVAAQLKLQLDERERIINEQQAEVEILQIRNNATTKLLSRPPNYYHDILMPAVCDYGKSGQEVERRNNHSQIQRR